jgi:hypothetical protein
MNMNQYSYDGPVMEFGNIIARRWQSSTYAESEGKARANLAYQFKVNNNKTRNAKIVLPGKLIPG